MADALRFIPVGATAVLVRNHQSLRQSRIPHLVYPGTGFDGRMGGIFSDEEIQLSAIAMLADQTVSAPGQRQHMACLQLAPGITAERLAQAWRLERDDLSYPGFTCYRRDGEPERSYFVVQQGATIAIGAEEVLKPRLRANPPQGPLVEHLTPFTAGNDLLIACLSDYGDLSLGEGYLQPLAMVLEPWLQDFNSLPPGSFNALAFALRVEGRPRLLVQLKAADPSLAIRTQGVINRNLERLQNDFAARRNVTEDAAGEIERFLAHTIDGMRVKARGQTLDVTVPLGEDSAALQRFATQIEQAQASGESFVDALRPALQTTERHGAP